DEKIVCLPWGVTQSLLRREPFARFVFAKNVEHRNGVRRSFHMADVDLTQLLSISQDIAQLFLKQLRFLFTQIQPRELGDVAHVNPRRVGHGQKWRCVASQITVAERTRTRTRNTIRPSRRSFRSEPRRSSTPPSYRLSLRAMETSRRFRPSFARISSS